MDSNSIFTNVKVIPLSKPAGSMVAHGSLLVAGVVEVRFTVIKGQKGVFASLPAKKGNKPDENGQIPWYPEVKIPNEEVRQTFQNVVKAEYAKVMGQGTGQEGAGEENQTPNTFEDNLPF